MDLITKGLLLSSKVSAGRTHKLSNNQFLDDFDLGTWPFYWIVRTNGIYLASLEAELKKSSLDVPSWRVLMLLENDRARSISYLADESIIKLSTMTRIIKRMQKDGLVEVRPKETDRRVTEAYLTAKGKDARPVAWGHANAVIQIAFDGLSPAELKQTVNTLSIITHNLTHN